MLLSDASTLIKHPLSSGRTSDKKTSAHLARRVKELVDERLAAVKEDRVDVRVQLVSDQLFDVLLNLWSKLLVVAHQQFQQLTNEPVQHPTNRTCVHLIGLLLLLLLVLAIPKWLYASGLPLGASLVPGSN